MKSKRTIPYQYEPLVTPRGWNGEELRFALRLTQILDDLYQKYSSLKQENSDLKKRLEKLEGN